jgi:hypothetical protein
VRRLLYRYAEQQLLLWGWLCNCSDHASCSLHNILGSHTEQNSIERKSVRLCMLCNKPCTTRCHVHAHAPSDQHTVINCCQLPAYIWMLFLPSTTLHIKHCLLCNVHLTLPTQMGPAINCLTFTDLPCALVTQSTTCVRCCCCAGFLLIAGDGGCVRQSTTVVRPGMGLAPVIRPGMGGGVYRQTTVVRPGLGH